MRRTPALIAPLTLVLALGGCLLEDAEPIDDPGLGEDKAESTSSNLPLRHLPGNLVIPTAIVQHEMRKVFRTEAELTQALQIANPGIDFENEWAVFYTPGVSTLLAGDRAYIQWVSLSLSGLTLKVTTRLESNGDCPWRTSRPFVMVAVPIPAEPPPYTRFYRSDRTRSCESDPEAPEEPPEIQYHDGVSFTLEQATGALRAANEASYDELTGAGITGTQRNIIMDNRPWSSLSQLASTPYIGTATMEKLRTLGASFGEIQYHDGVSFTAEQAAGALAAANEASYDELTGAGITGTQRNIILNGRTWSSLAQVAGTSYIGPVTMEKLRTLGASF